MNKVGIIIASLILAMAVGLSGCVAILPGAETPPQAEAPPAPPEEAPEAPVLPPAEGPSEPAQVILTESFTLGESITDQERARMFPEFDDPEAKIPEFPFNMYDGYFGESFFLKSDETAEVLIKSDCPMCIWEEPPELEGGLWVSIGPSLEYEEQWQQYEINWDALYDECDLQLERSNNAWSAILTVNNPPASGYYEVCFLNTSANSVWCQYTVSVR